MMVHKNLVKTGMPMNHKEAFQHAIMSIPEGSTCYWLIKKEGLHGKPVKVGKVIASTDLDIYEHVYCEYGGGEYLATLYSNDEERLSEIIRFEVPSEPEEYDIEDKPDTIESIIADVASKIKGEIGLKQLLKIRDELSDSGKKEKVEQNMNPNFVTRDDLAKVLERMEQMDRRAEERAKEQQQNMQQNSFNQFLIKSQETQNESNRMMMESQKEMTKMFMAMIENKNDKKDFWDSPMAAKIMEKLMDKPDKSPVEELLPKIYESMYGTTQKTMDHIIKLYSENGQTDAFVQKAKVIQEMAGQAIPEIKDFIVQMAAVKAKKEVDIVKSKETQSQQENTQRQRRKIQQENTQSQHTQQQTTERRKPTVTTINRQQQTQQQPTQQNINLEEMKSFFFNVYTRYKDEKEDIAVIEKMIRNKKGAIETIKTNIELQQFAMSQGGELQELFERLRDE